MPTLCKLPARVVLPHARQQCQDKPASSCLLCALRLQGIRSLSHLVLHGEGQRRLAACVCCTNLADAGQEFDHLCAAIGRCVVEGTVAGRVDSSSAGFLLQEDLDNCWAVGTDGVAEASDTLSVLVVDIPISGRVQEPLKRL